jgi:DNA polymerase-3 subunit alpha
MPSLFLFIEGNVVRKSWGDQNLEFKIRTIDLLNELGVKRTKGLQLRVNADSIGPELIQEIENVCKEFAGQTPLYLNLRDDRENITLEMLSRKFRIKPVNEMVRKMKNLPQVEVEIVY